jgi:formylglycine-generating enzyme required for sulfatase activity
MVAASALQRVSLCVVLIAIVCTTALVHAQVRPTQSSFQDCAECPSMRAIPPSRNANAASSDMPIAVSVTPITFAQWDRCAVSGGCNDYRPDRQTWSRDTPVVNVSYLDAQSYIGWLKKKTGANYRLVREHEWAHVALGGRKTAFPWGNEKGRAKTNCLDCGSRWDGLRASPVKSFAANEFGLYDVIGNVAHWTDVDPTHTVLSHSFCKEKGEYAAIMGASWAEPSSYLDVKQWACFPKVLRDDTIGFRVVREMS